MSADPARNRFIVINVVRVTGVAMVLTALLILAGKIDLPQPAAIVLAGLGMIEVFVMPLVLSRRWKSPRQ